jgi:hypothetical protein
VDLTKVSRAELIREIKRLRNFKIYLSSYCSDEWRISRAAVEGVMSAHLDNTYPTSNNVLNFALNDIGSIEFIRGVIFTLQEIKRQCWQNEEEIWDNKKYKYEDLYNAIVKELYRRKN